MTRRGALLLVALAACAPGDSAAPPSVPPTTSGASVKTPSVLDLRAPSDVCFVHGELLREDTIPIAYGFIGGDSPTFDSVACPYVGRAVSGGCVVDEKHFQALVKFCPICRAERAQRYAAAHPDDTGCIPAGQDEPRLRTVISLEQQRAIAAYAASHPPAQGSPAH